MKKGEKYADKIWVLNDFAVRSLMKVDEWHISQKTQIQKIGLSFITSEQLPDQDTAFETVN